MNTAVKVLLVAVVLFSGAAAGSWFLQNHLRAESDATRQLAEGSLKGGKASPAAGSPSPGGDGKSTKGSFRPPYVPEAEKLSQMAANLQQQTESHKARERQLSARQKNLEVILHDLRNEQKSLDEVRKTLGEELKLLGEKMSLLDKKSLDTRQQGASLDGKLDELKKGLLEVSRVEKTQVDHLGKVYNVMEIDAAAQTLQDLVEKGKLDTAVKLLDSMKERQAAQVLSKLSNTSVAAQLVERLLALKTANKKSP